MFSQSLGHLSWFLYLFILSTIYVSHQNHRSTIVYYENRIFFFSFKRGETGARERERERSREDRGKRQTRERGDEGECKKVKMCVRVVSWCDVCHLCVGACSLSFSLTPHSSVQCKVALVRQGSLERKIKFESVRVMRTSHRNNTSERGGCSASLGALSGTFGRPGPRRVHTGTIKPRNREPKDKSPEICSPCLSFLCEKKKKNTTLALRKKNEV